MAPPTSVGCMVIGFNSSYLIIGFLAHALRVTLEFELYRVATTWGIGTRGMRRGP